MIKKLNVNENGTLSQSITLCYDNNAIITEIRARKLIVTMNTTRGTTLYDGVQHFIYQRKQQTIN